MLYLFGENGGVAGLATCSPEGMEMKGQMQVEGSGPQLGPSRRHRRTALPAIRRNLYCFDVRDET